MVHFTGLLENARHPVAGLLLGDPGGGPCKNRVRAGIGGSPGTATGGQIHVVHISHTHPPKEIIQALRKYLLGKKNLQFNRFCLLLALRWLPTTHAAAPCGGKDNLKPRFSSIWTNLFFRAGRGVLRYGLRAVRVNGATNKHCAAVL